MPIIMGRPVAEARIRGGEDNPCLRGVVRFYQMNRCVLVETDISGLPRDSATGFFALHIHEGTDCCGEGFANTGGHYNPGSKPHPCHAGDLPPLLCADGRAYLAVMTDRFRICDVLGKTVVIHSGADDFHSQPAGNPGSKLACGVIRKL